MSDEEQEELNRSVRVKSLSRGIKYYRDGLGLEPVVPEFVRHVTEPGFEDCVEESRVFHTLFENPTLDPLTLAEKIWAEQRPLVLP